ncbi:Arylsulfatase [Novipirellula galeiformis]|uniref:Arylsulfatase n=1 Tax=Novipirellula galeiformis TaxID=2528004 RepID=A0A5C6CM84_9BACT|nr:sulfatase [Novipirellula galeiformis]TWU24266.1 Arylsulfatase [Novipirellula galeiformis]
MARHSMQSNSTRDSVRFRAPIAVVFILLGWVLSLCVTNDGNAAERNVIFIITDDESPTLGCYGDAIAKTPAIDAIAADGVLFRNAFATTASCSASRSVVMSGLHNHRNGQFGHQHHYHKFASFHDVVRLSLPQVMKNAGYRTGQIGKYHVAPEAVFHFETYLKGNSRNAVEMADASRDFITDLSDDRPFFLYFATSDPHRGGGVDETSHLELKPNRFGNKAKRGAYPGVEEVFYDPKDVVVPAFLPDTPETREELAQYYQSCSRIDQGVARLVEILKANDLYDKTMIVFTSDHGMAFAGGKTTVYEGGLRVPFVVRDPYQSVRGVESEALLSHVDITPSILDFADGLNRKTNAPKNPINVKKFWAERDEAIMDNRNGGQAFDSYHGKSWLHLLANPSEPHHETIFASHTFHEIQMYYPMRVVRDKHYKLIWNIAHPLPYPFASDLWAASSWQAQWKQGPDAVYGNKTVDGYIHRPEFELYDIAADPNEMSNLAESEGHQDILDRYKAKLKSMQKELQDPWIMKWDYE